MSVSDNNKVNEYDYPSITEGEWYALAIVFSIFTLVVAGVVLWWIFNGGYPKEISVRVSIAGMVVTFCGVVTTFCTVAWRGMITTRQADAGLLQIEATRQQIAITEENNLAILLQKGVEYIAEGGKSRRLQPA